VSITGNYTNAHKQNKKIIIVEAYTRILDNNYGKVILHAKVWLKLINKMLSKRNQAKKRIYTYHKAWK
jgi:hypothetical protein